MSTRPSFDQKIMAVSLGAITAIPSMLGKIYQYRGFEKIQILTGFMGMLLVVYLIFGKYQKIVACFFVGFWGVPLFIVLTIAFPEIAMRLLENLMKI